MVSLIASGQPTWCFTVPSVCQVREYDMVLRQTGVFTWFCVGRRRLLDSAVCLRSGQARLSAQGFLPDRDCESCHFQRFGGAWGKFGSVCKHTHVVPKPTAGGDLNQHYGGVGICAHTHAHVQKCTKHWRVHAGKRGLTLGVIHMVLQGQN